MCLADQKIWEASKHLLECKVYSQKFWDIKNLDLNRPETSLITYTIHETLLRSKKHR